MNIKQPIKQYAKTDEIIVSLEKIFQDTANENCSPNFSIMNCVKKLKAISSKILKEEYPELKSRLPSLWTRNMFVSSMGTVTMEEINRFYEEQKGK